MAEDSLLALQYEPIALPSRPFADNALLSQRTEAFYREMSTRHTVRDFSPAPVPRAVIETAIRTAGRAPSGANQQPWHFAAISDSAAKRAIRLAAEEEERAFYAGRGGAEWLRTLAPLGTDPEKPFLEVAPWLIVVFAARHGVAPDGQKIKHYYAQESVGIATGILIAALHQAGLATLTHTPNPMKFLNRICRRPAREKPFLILVAGHPAAGATIPKAATLKKPLEEIASFL